jgi:replicative DNA helicase
VIEDRVLPHSLEAERAVLGAVLISEAAFPKAAAVLHRSDFFRDAHQRIYAAMQVMCERGVAVDYVTLSAELGRTGSLDECGGPAYVSALTDGVPRSVNVEHYARIVKEKALLRELVSAANRALADAYADDRPAARIADDAVSGILATIGRGRSGQAVDVSAAVRSYVSALHAGTMAMPVPTGYRDLDALMDGFRPEELVIVAARPSVGKTSFALGVAESMARRNLLAGSTAAILFFSLEMGVHGIAERLVGWHADVSVATVVRGEATLEQAAKVTESMEGYDGVPLRIETSAGTLSEIDAWCRIVAQEQGLAGVVVDYMQLLGVEGRHHSQEAEMASISRGSKRLAKDLAVPFVALSQLSRAPEGRSDKRPHTSDLRGSGALEQDADVVVLLHRPEMYQRTPENDGVAEVIVAKNRNGPTGIVRAYFEKRIARFRDMQQHDMGYQDDV